MIADKGLLGEEWPRRFRSTAEAFCTTDMRGRRRDLNVGQQSLIRGSNRMTLLRLGLPLSRWRASKAHSTHEGSPALSCPQRRIPRRGLFWVCNLLCWLSVKSWSRRLWRGLNCAGNRPDEAHHFACDSDIDDVSGLAARAQSTISGAEPDLRFPLVRSSRPATSPFPCSSSAPAGACFILVKEVFALSGKAPRVVPLKQANFVLCTGLADPWHETPADYDEILAAMRARNLELICANPDIVVEDGGKLFYCAGAIAERYDGAGGKVTQAGKPFAPIFTRALELARGPGTKTINHARVLVIGDAMRTDIKGAHDQGFDSLFVTSGIHRKELHGPARGAALDATAFRQFVEAADFAPTAAIPALVW